MINLILNLLNKIPYRTKFGLAIDEVIKIWYYWKLGQFLHPQKCLCVVK